MTLALLITAATGAWAQESESITTTLPETKEGSVEFTGTHFKITGQRADNDGMNLGSSTKRTITISALNGEIITKVEMTIGFKFYSWQWEVLSTKGNVSGNYTSGYNLTLTDVNVSEVTLSASNTTTGFLQFNKFKIFYVPAGTMVLDSDKTTATMTMPANDVTVDYELVRDMEYKVNAYVGDDAEVTYRHRVEKVSDNLYKPVNITDDAQIIALFNVIDTIDAASPKPLVYGTDFTVTIVDEDQNETVPAEFNFAPGIYTVKVTGIGDYDGLIDSRNQFKLYYGYELKVAPGNYATYYKDEPLTTADENAELYTIASINGSKAVLSEQMQSVPKNTPFLIYNNHQTDTVTFVLIPVEGGQLSLIQYAPEFKGTLNDSIMPASSEGTKYYICNGYDFVWVRNAGTIAANRCWLEISNSNARALNIVFGDEATSIKNLTPTLSEGEGAWYDLNGRKLNGMPTRKGVYILNGKKTVIK